MHGRSRRTRAWQGHARARGHTTRMRVATNRAGILLAIMRPGHGWLDPSCEPAAAGHKYGERPTIVATSRHQIDKNNIISLGVADVGHICLESSPYRCRRYCMNNIDNIRLHLSDFLQPIIIPVNALVVITG